MSNGRWQGPLKCACGGGLDEVRDSRSYPNRIRRQRKCNVCQERTTTYEYPVHVVTKWKHDSESLARLREILNQTTAATPEEADPVSEMAGV